MTGARIFRLALALALAFLAVGLGGLSVYRKVQAFQPLGFEAVAKGGALAVVQVYTPQTGLQRGDQILLVNGGEVASRSQLVQHIEERPASVLTVMRGEQLSQIRYVRPAVRFDLAYLILAVIGAAYLGVGLFTLVRHSGRQGFLFYLWCLTSATLYLLSATPPADVLYAATSLFDTMAYIFLPALTVHLFLVFPTVLPGSERFRRLIPFLYLPAAALAALELDLALFNGRLIFGRPTLARVDAFDRVQMAHLALFALAAMAILFRRFRRGASWEQHRQLQWIAYGVGGGYLPFLILYYVPTALNLAVPMALSSLAVVPLGLVPLTFAYAILRYKLWDIEVIVRDTISWTLTLLLGIIGFSLINLAVDRGISEQMSLARNLLSFVSGLGIASLLVPTRSAISSTLERLHYRDTFGKRQALTGFGREMLHERDLGKLCAALLDRIGDGVSLERANLYLAQGETLLAVRPEPELPPRLAFDALGAELWGRSFLPLSGLAMPGEPLSLSTRLFVAGYRYAFPLAVRGRGIGIVLAGYRRDHAPLNSEDTALIRHLLDQAALAIENAQLVGQLQVRLEEVEQLQRYTEGIFESSPAGIAVLDGDRRLVSVNGAFAQLAGFAPDRRAELIGRGLEETLPVEPIPAPGEGPLEVSWCDATGAEHHLQLSLAAFDRGWRQGLYVLVVHDVSERVAMENALREKDRLAALGMLAAGVAHEVNTPITGISSYAQMLLDDTSPDDPHYAILQKVERQTFRAARIVNNLLEFARRRQNEPKTVDLAPLLSESLDLLGDRMLKRRIEVAWDLPSEPLLVLGCDGELQQVFTNLVLNAIDAISGMSETGGRLAVSLAANGPWVTARFCDNGPGIAAEKLEMIFQPFYSTKLNSGGTGLGLSISYDIVRRHGGDLRVESRPGEGACFVVELPRHPPAAASLA
jgi:signal transduction histidine kinase